MSKRESEKHLEEATHLDFSHEKLQNYYGKWATAYNSDVVDEEYVAPNIITELLESLNLPKSIKILDAGCGTGLLGTIINEAGYQSVSGFDLSSEMVEMAKLTNRYNELKGNVDIMKVSQHFPLDHFDSIVSSGVFTLGHVPPEAILSLLSIVKSGGYLVVSTRTQYNDATDYFNYHQSWVDDGTIEVITELHLQPYTKLDTSTYWIYRKP